jgi:lipoate-protein ligase A
LVGSAQVWKDESLLQQGSLPLDDRAAEFFAMLRFSTPTEQEEALAAYREKTTPLHSFVPTTSWNEVAQAFQAGFSSTLHHTFLPAELSESEWALAQQLVEEKYSKLTWRKEKLTLISSNS